MSCVQANFVIVVGELIQTSYGFTLLHSIYFPSSVSYSAGDRMAPHRQLWVLYLRDVLDHKSCLLHVYSALFSRWRLASLPQILFQFHLFVMFFIVSLSTVTDPRMIHTVYHRAPPVRLSSFNDVSGFGKQRMIFPFVAIIDVTLSVPIPQCRGYY